MKPVARSRAARHRIRLAAIVAIAVTAALSLAAPAAAVTGWTGPTRIAAGSGLAGQLGVDSSGFVHVVVIDDVGLLYRTNRPSGTWHSVRLVSGKDIYAADVSVGVSGNGHVFIAWSPHAIDGITNQGIWYLTNANGGSNHGWPSSSTLLVSGNVRLPALKIFNGNIHLAYVQAEHVHYTTNQSGSWASVTVTSDISDGSVNLALDSAGKARIAWGDGSHIKYAANVGSAASPSFRVLSVPGTGCRPHGSGAIQCFDGPALALDAHGHPHLAFGRYTNPSGTASRTSPAACCTTDGLNYAVFNGTSWTPANQREILTGSLFGGPDMVLNKQGHAHLLVDASPGIDPNPFELTNAAGGGFTRTKLSNTQFESQSLALTAAGKPVVLLLRCCSSATEGLCLMKKS